MTRVDTEPQAADEPERTDGVDAAAVAAVTALPGVAAVYPPRNAVAAAADGIKRALAADDPVEVDVLIATSGDAVSPDVARSAADELRRTTDGVVRVRIARIAD
ncbi:hypothetical protein ACFWHR_14270 [Leucobacter sp. NPDC058333]|uniref:hypothetical protein n=1 Tax=Leucobacter sp. NPDC058333 TaxID=3346450 RepID=UPI00365C32C9